LIIKIKLKALFAP